jgi:hypothetical protein
MLVVRPRGKTYWTEFSKRIKASSFTEGVLKKVKRYRRDKLIREQGERGRDEAPTIIPFPTEEKQATDEPADTSDDA